jgi:hypothetical protein
VAFTQLLFRVLLIQDDYSFVYLFKPTFVLIINDAVIMLRLGDVKS